MNGTLRLCMLTLAAAFIVSLGAYGSALAEKRVALVIGNSKYVHASELKNPANDANAMAAQLKALDFQVIKGTDLDETGMRSAIKQFSDALADSKVALVFYAGHGIQVEGNNYLLPVTAELNNEIDLQFQGVSIDLLLRIMESPKRTSILLLDACRNNPLASRLARSMSQGGRQGSVIAPGLARIETGVGTYIGFATSPNSVALDGDGENSPFTTALVKHIHAENEDIESVMRNVREDVMKSTNGSQVPWGNSSLVGRGFMFKEKTEEKPAEVAQPKVEPQPEPRAAQQNLQDLIQGLNNSRVQSNSDREMEITFWNSIQGSSDPGFFELYLQEYPNGAFAGLARLNIAKLTRQQAAAAPVEAPKPVEVPVIAEAPKPVEQPKVAEAPRPVEQPVVAAPSGYGQAAAADDEAEVKVAALTPQKEETRGLEIVTATRPETQISGPEVYEPLQSELNRLGCDVGRVDGKWGNRSQKALEEAARRASLKVAAVEPTREILDMLRQQSARLCPLVCQRGFEERGGACVRIAIVQPEPPTAKPAAKPAAKPRQQAQPRVVIKAAPPPTVSVRPRACGINCVQKNIHESNRHMPPGVDSDGNQM